MDNFLIEMAKKAQQAKDAAAAEKNLELQREKGLRIAFLTEQFKDRFSDFFPSFRMLGITWQACTEDNDTSSGYIKFKRGDNELRMDFHGRYSYRYEYTPARTGRNGRMVFDQWGDTGFADFLTTGLNIKF
jgi:hypothetical protein